MKTKKGKGRKNGNRYRGREEGCWKEGSEKEGVNWIERELAFMFYPLKSYFTYT